MYWLILCLFLQLIHHLLASTKEVLINISFITFAWNPVTVGCSAFHYRIIATNCGICPSTTVYDTVNCVMHSVTTTVNLCLFAVQSVFCGSATAGNVSEPIRVMLAV